MPPAPSAAPRGKTLAAFIAMVLIWGYSWVVFAVALRHAHPFDFAALRMGIGCALLFGVVAARGGRLRLAEYRSALVIGLLQMGLFIVLSQYAVILAGPGKTAILVFTMPFWAIVFSYLLLGEPLHGSRWLAVALAFAGLMAIVQPWRLQSLAGSLLAIAAGAAWALAAVLSKKWRAGAAGPMTFTAWQFLFAFIALAIIAMLHPHEAIRWNAEFVAALLFTSVLATAAAWMLWAYVLARTSAGIAGLNALGIPAVAVLFSALQLGERPSAFELAGMGLILLALALLSLRGLRK